MDRESQLVERTARAIPSRAGGLLRLGIGDDAAILSPRRGMDWVLTCDAFLEGIHFLANLHPADSVGYKALARATSDLAAMGATPRLFLLTMAIPSSRTGAWLDSFLRGMSRAARELGLRLAGGDTTRSTKVFVSITVLGDIAEGRAVRRSGARPGDHIYVSGPLGLADLGLEMVRREIGRGHRLRKFLRAHFFPQIQIELGAWLARRGIPSAMMDISDGLSTDLARLCLASQVGARIEAGRLPCVRIPEQIARRLPGRARDPLPLALHGGDDYVLLFTVPPKKEKLLRRAPGFRHFARIGVITRDRRIVLVHESGQAEILRPLGWDPFRQSS
ncbi:MAG TPA: thiamine-phosphate kinase [Candidatus Limnocylindrales bacterium]|nr:thiamine-phosphate kinase [Candidatus Limnocylindrales bacterium]